MIVTDSYIRATSLIGFQELVEKAGGNAESLLREADISPALLSKPDALMSYNKFGNLLEIGARELNRPSLGLEWALSAPPHFPGLGPLTLLANFVSTIQEWIDTGLEYWKYHTDGFSLEQRIDEATGLVALRHVTSSFAFPSRQLTELTFGNVCRMAKTTTGHFEVNPTLMRFQHSKPKDTSAHEKVFGCPIEFSAEHDEILFRPEILQLKTNGNLTFFKPLLGYYIKCRIDRLPVYNQSMTTTVTLAIPSVLGTGSCNIEFIAEHIGLSQKKLRRLLAAEGTTFSELLDNQRSTMAREFLAGSDAPVSRIAGLLDYSATPPFTLAFKRWTGMSPVAFRKKVRSEAGAGG